MVVMRVTCVLQLQGHFTHIIVDEAAQLTESEALLPLSLAGPETSVVMAGDPQQLGPSTFTKVPATHQSEGSTRIKASAPTLILIIASHHSPALHVSSPFLTLPPIITFSSFPPNNHPLVLSASPPLALSSPGRLPPRRKYSSLHLHFWLLPVPQPIGST